MKNRTLPTRLRAYSWFNRLLKLTLGLYLQYRFNIRVISRKTVTTMKPPYLLLPNHVGYWDPFMVGVYVPQPVHFVAADAVFRSPLVRRLLGLAGAVPKTKGVSDLEMLRQLLRIRDAGGVIGIFAEGGRTWDGATLPLMPGTAKLVKFLKIPVLCPMIRGGFLSHPRWARAPRRGSLYIDYRYILSAEEVQRMPVAEIAAVLQEALSHDEHAWRRRNGMRYRSSRPAEYAEHLLFLCPSCRSLATMHSSRSTLRCSSCGYAVTLDAQGCISPDHHFPGIRDWHRWELTEIKERVRPSRHMTHGGDGGSDRRSPVLLRDSGIICRWGFRTNRLHEHGVGVLELDAEELRFIPGTAGSCRDSASEERPGMLRFPLKELRGVNIQLLRDLELYYGETLYTLTPRSLRVSMYKWELFISALR